MKRRLPDHESFFKDGERKFGFIGRVIPKRKRPPEETDKKDNAIFNPPTKNKVVGRSKLLKKNKGTDKIPRLAPRVLKP